VYTTTRNAYIVTYRSLYKFAQDIREIDIKNPFKTLKIVNVSQKIMNGIKTISAGEVKTLFEMLRSAKELNEEITYFSKKKNKYRTETKKYYQPYLLDGIRLALALGYRSQNIAEVNGRT